MGKNASERFAEAPPNGSRRAGRETTNLGQCEHDCPNKYCLADYLKVCRVALRGKCPQRGDGYSCPHFRFDVLCYQIDDFHEYFKPFSEVE